VGWVTRLCAAISVRNPWSVASRPSAPVSSSKSPPSSPSLPGAMNSATPLPAWATTGTPASRASSAASPNDSRAAGARKMSAAANTSRTPSRSSRPASRTQPAMSCRRMNRTMRGRAGPSPTMVARSGTAVDTRRRVAANSRSSLTGSLRGASLPTDTIWTPCRQDRPASAATGRHRAVSIPLHTTSTGTRPAITARTGPAAASLTAVTTTPDEYRPQRAASPR
jgi:hypothetical protein